MPNNIKVIKVEYLYIPEMFHVDGPVYKYEESYNIEIFLEDGYSTIVLNTKPAKCKSCFKDGYYQPYSTGDIDGWEHRCDKCGSKVFSPEIYYGRNG